VCAGTYCFVPYLISVAVNCTTSDQGFFCGEGVRNFKNNELVPKKFSGLLKYKYCNGIREKEWKGWCARKICTRTRKTR
jgi:hypothetical protein